MLNNKKVQNIMVSNLNNQALNPNLANYDPAVLDEIRKNTDNYN